MEDYTPKHSDVSASQKNKNIKKIICYIAIAIIAALLISSIIVFLVNFFSGRDGFGQYKTSTTSTVSTVLPANPIDFDAIKEKNEDVFAWIQIPGIEVIDYPILQSDADTDDNYYLNHNIDRKSDPYGEIYIQKLNSVTFTDPATLIYGHNMLNGTMFAQLAKYRDKEFFNENRQVFIYTPGHILEYEIVSAFVYDDRHILNSFNFSLLDERQKFFDECVNPTSYTKQVAEDAKLDLNDNIIVLSTCTANDSERYLVVAKLLSDTLTVR